MRTALTRQNPSDSTNGRAYFGTRPARPAAVGRLALIAFGLLLAGWPAPGRAAEAFPTLPPEAAEVLKQSREKKPEQAAEAEALLREYLVRDRNPAVLYELGRRRAAAGDYREAVDLAREAFRRDPEFPHLAIGLGQLLAALERPADAIRYLQAYIVKDGPDPLAYRLLAHCYLQLEDPVAAESALRQALALCAPEGGDLRLLLAQALYRQENYAGAAAAAAQVTRTEPERSDAWAMLASARLAENKLEAAADALEAACRLGGKKTDPRRLTLGDVYARLGLLEQAQANYAQTEGELGPTRRLYLAQAYLTRENYAEAEKQLSAALAELPEPAAPAADPKTGETPPPPRSPERAKALVLRARVRLGQGQAPEAKADLAAALRADPLSGEALVELARQELAAGDFANAAAHFRSARVLEGWEESARWGEIDTLLRSGRRDEARRLTEELAAKYPTEAARALARRLTP